MKTKFFRVARAGKTTDLREITPEHITQMAENYNPSLFGARIWMEHIRSFSPDGTFKAYGDVLELKADTDEEGVAVLLARIDATKEMVEISRNRQKIYWSVEMTENFANKGHVYLTGLAMTDTPASLGTEPVKFSQTPGPSCFSAAYEGAHLMSVLESDTPPAEDSVTPAPATDVFSKVKDILTGQSRRDTARFTELEKSTLTLAEDAASLRETVNAKADATAVHTLSAQVEALSKNLSTLTETLSQTAQHPDRDAISGRRGDIETDC